MMTITEVLQSAHFVLEVRRLRLEHWRVVYIVDEQSAGVGVLAIRKRPLYDYNDLPELLAGLQD